VNDFFSKFVAIPVLKPFVHSLVCSFAISFTFVCLLVCFSLLNFFSFTRLFISFCFVSLSVPCYAIDIILLKDMGFITAS